MLGRHRRSTSGLLVVALALLWLPGMTTAGASAPTLSDGPAPCSAGPPPLVLHGSCATYDGYNTFYGTYGPGFPTPLGWALCAWAPATGGWYPVPAYGYVATDPPPGADTSLMGALGYAFSEATLTGYWQGTARWSADDAAVAAKLYYDSLVWHMPWPAVSPGIQAAANYLYTLAANEAQGAGTPTMTLSLPGGATSFTTATTATARLAYPGTGAPLPGIPVSFSLSGATFDATGTASLIATTALDGTVVLPLTATSSVASTVTLSASFSIGATGLVTERASQPTAQNAQEIAAPLAPVAAVVSASWSSLAPPPPLGRLALQKGGDDTPYLGVAGATFDLLSGSSIVATLVTDDLGHAGPSARLLVGTYTLHEAIPPPGYQSVADRTVSIVANTTTTISLVGAQGDRAIPATVSLSKVNDRTGAPLAGAVLELAYDATDAGTYVSLGTCTTDVTGTCLPAGTSSLLPGYYRATEISPPPGYLLNPVSAVQYVELGPGEHASLTFADDVILTTLFVQKSNALEPGQGVPGAGYDLYVEGTPPHSAPPSGPLGAPLHDSLTWYASGTTDATGHLGFTIPVGYSWCVAERSSPPEFVLDPALRCTAVIDQHSPDPVRTVAVSEQPLLITLSALKFNAANPGLVIPDATYGLFVEGAFPPGFTPPMTPSGVSVPPGDALWAISRTDAGGQLRFSLPSGHAWCLRELMVPAGYVLDAGLHCTAVLSADANSATTVALPELAMTGATLSTLLSAAALLFGVGITAQLTSVRRRRS